MGNVATEFTGGGEPKRVIELLWGLEERGRRGPKPRLTVPQVAAAAIALADAEGLGALSMRRLAEQLGLTAMSLYTYVPGKAELIDVMVDAALGEVLKSAEEGTGWRSALERVARDNWTMYLRHPWLLQVATSRPVLGPNLIAKYDRELRAVEGIGLTDVEMDLVITIVGDYVRGAARAAVEAAQAEQRSGMNDTEWWAAFAPILERVSDPSRHPVAARVGVASGQEYGAAVDPERAYRFGLERLLDGIAVLVGSRRA